MSDIRTDLREKFRDIMDEKFKNNPDDIGMLKTPIGEFADAAADMIGALPSPPRYYAGDDQSRFSSMLTQDELAAKGFDSLSARFDPETGTVVLVVTSGETGKITNIGLDPTTGEQFAHQYLAVVRHAREQSVN